MNLNELAKEIHQNAKDHGFYEAEIETLSEIMLCNDIVEGIRKQKVVRHAFFAQKIALIHSELSECLEANRMDSFSIDTEIEDDIDFVKSFKLLVKNTVEDELADVLIRTLDLCASLNIDIEKQVELKMKYNSLLEHKHNKEY